MIKTAVILAAGLGSRLGEKTKHKPKGFMQIDGKSIIEMSIAKLIEIGISNILIGTGYLADEYGKLSSKYSETKCIYNEKYANTGSMYTLYNMKNYISEDFILLESDLIYEKKGLNILINHSEPDVILASSFTHSHDEVFIEKDKNNFLVNMSKNIEMLSSTDSELVGIAKISCSTFKEMCSYLETNLKQNPRLDYEEALVGVSAKVNILVNRIEGLKWCEIDDENHLLRAVNYIYPIIKMNENTRLSINRTILLNPGPATTSDSVKYAQVVPDICPREKEFGEVMQFISTELVKLVGCPEKYTAVLFGGSGTAAVEAILSSVVDKDYVLIINNGEYGKRMCEIAQIYGLNYIEYKSSYYGAVDLEDLENIIASSNKKISHLAVVHNETTTGLLNPIQELGTMCKKYDIDLIVDAMSSFAAVPIDMKKMNISYLASSSNKNLQGMAGVSFVIGDKVKLKSTKNIKPRNLYLNLHLQYKYFIDKHQMRFTPPVQTLYALKQAIIETIIEGVDKRYERYQKSWETLIEGITKLGLTYLVNKENHSKIITAIVEPKCEKYDFYTMHDYFYNRGITIYPGKLSNLDTFRIANIGDINPEDIKCFIELLKQYLEDIEYFR